MAAGPASLAFRDARLVDPVAGSETRGDVVVRDGLIAGIGPGLLAGAEAEAGISEIVECGGLCLAPGLVDMRVQLREPGEEHKETIETASRAAARGGVTAMICLPDTDPVIDDVAGIEYIARRAREVRGVKVFVHAAATRRLEGREITEMGLLSEMGALAFTDGTRAIADPLVMRRALSWARTFGLLIIQHPEEPVLASDGDMNEGEIATRLGLAGIPACAEVMLVERDLRLVELTGGRYHVGHVSTAATVAAIRAARARGLPVTCDTAPHYFALNETAIGDYRTFAKVSPPLRQESDRRAVVEGLVDGTISAIASDHAPQDQDSKRVPFSMAEPGAAGLETLLPVALELVHNGHLSLPELWARLTTGPAEILGLNLGRLEPGAPADLVLFDPERPWQVDADALLSKSKNSIFDGRPVQGRAVMTLVGGRILHREDGDA